MRSSDNLRRGRFHLPDNLRCQLLLLGTICGMHVRCPVSPLQHAANTPVLLKITGCKPQDEKEIRVLQYWGGLDYKDV